MDAGRAALLYEIAQRLGALIDIEDLLRYLTGQAKELFHAESAAVLLLDADSDELLFPYVDDDDPEKAARLRALRLPKDQGVAGWVLTHDEPVLIADVNGDSRFYAGVDAATGRATCNLLCVPLRTRRGVIGVFELVNRQGGSFTNGDLEFLEALSGSVSVAVENATL